MNTLRRLYSPDFIAGMMAELEAIAVEYTQTREAMVEARAMVQMRYEILRLTHKYAEANGVDVGPLPEPPQLYQPGVAKRRKLAKAARLAAARAASRPEGPTPLARSRLEGTTARRDDRERPTDGGLA